MVEQKKESYWSILDTWIPGFLVGAIIIAMGFEIIARKFFSYSLVWLLEIVELGFTWLIMLGGAGAFRKKELIKVDCISMYLPFRAKSYLSLFEMFLTVLIALFLCYTGFELTQTLYPQKTAILRISLSWRTAALSVGMGLISIYAIIQFLDRLRNVRRDTRFTRDESKNDSKTGA